MLFGVGSNVIICTCLNFYLELFIGIGLTEELNFG